MRIAGGADLSSVLDALCQERPVFHSEADFQHAFAWAVQRAMPDARVRLEARLAPGARLDLLVASTVTQRCSAIELKYLTRAWSGEINGERFELKNQGAQDIRGYDVIKDIGRVEQDAQLLQDCNGAAIVLSNEPSYWTSPSHDRQTNAAAFRLYDSLVLHGERAWGPSTGAGTLRGRELPVTLRGTYQLRWRDYSRVPGPSGLFRLLVVEVSESRAPPTEPQGGTVPAPNTGTVSLHPPKLSAGGPR